MPYFNIFNCLFIHIPKTGGTSVEKYFMKKLKRQLNNYDLYTDTDNDTYDHIYGKSYQHMTYSTIEYNKQLIFKNLNINIDNIDKIFTIVRNPYERILSELVYRGYITFLSTKCDVFKKLKEYIYSTNTTFDNHIIPQYKFLVCKMGKLNNNITIMKTETLTQDMITYGFIDFNENENITYRNKYNYFDLLNIDSITLINDYYSKDFEYFNYTHFNPLNEQSSNLVDCSINSKTHSIINKTFGNLQPNAVQESNDYFISNTHLYKNMFHEKILFISIADNIQKAEYLLKSANIWNLHIHIINIEKWSGFSDKIIRVRQYIEPYSDDLIVCFVDAYDVLMLASEKYILQKFLSYNCNILFSSELNCYPKNNIDLYDKYYNNHPAITKYKYINSGGYIGYKKDIYNMLTWKKNEDIVFLCKNCGDQNYFTNYFLCNESFVSIKMDHKQYIFQNFAGVNINEFIFRNGHLYNTILDTYPCIIHFNGFLDMDIKKVIDIVTNIEINILELFINKLMKSINGDIQTFYHKPPYVILPQK